MTDTLIITDTFISKMLRNPAWSAAFPFLASSAALAKSAKKGCSSCKRRPIPGVDFGEIKRAIASLGASERERFRKLAGAHKVKVLFRDRMGTVQKVTF